MTIWLNTLHNDERVFWHTMTPYRCAVLYREHFRMRYPRVPVQPQPQKRDLFDYIMGGGG